MRVSERITNMTADPATREPTYQSVSIEISILMVMLSIFSVVGTVGNGLVIFVFQRVRDKSTSHVFIISMAVIDLFTCMVIIPMTMFVEYSRGDIKYDFLCKLYHFLITSKIPLSAFIMVAIAFDRYFCICHPLRRIITINRARSIVVCMALLSSFFGVLTSLFYGVYHVIERIDFNRIDDELGTNFSNVVSNVDEYVALEERTHHYSNIRERFYSYLHSKNVLFNGTMYNVLPVVSDVVDVGICSPSHVIFGESLFNIYQRTYMAVYPMCLVTVMILYFMIYRFMCQRRSKKLKQKLIMCSYVNGDGTFENTRLVSGEVEETRKDSINIPITDTPGQFPRSVTGFNGFSTSPKSFSESQKQEENPGEVLATEETHKHDSSFIADETSRNNISSSSTIITNIVTPTDNDDNTPILSFGNSCSSHNNSFRHSTTDRSQLVFGRRHSRLPEQKYHWHKNRDSMKRYKGKSKRRGSPYGSDADRLREENRSANVRTALMLFTVTLVFMVAFVPAWVMAHRLIHYSEPIFYLYFIYNVVNPFIYAFMNHIFKNYMRKVFTCRKLTISQRRSS